LSKFLFLTRRGWVILARGLAESNVVSVMAIAQADYSAAPN